MMSTNMFPIYSKYSLGDYNMNENAQLYFLNGSLMEIAYRLDSS